MLNRIKVLKKRLSANPDNKSLLSNFGYLTLLQVSTYLIPIITIPYLAGVIGVDGFGKIAFAAAVIVWFQTITDWGFNYTATRDVAKNRKNLDKISEIFSRVFWTKILLMLVTFIFLILLILVLPFFNENKNILFASFLIIPGQILLSEWFFQAIEKMKFITIFSLLSKILATVMIFVFIKDKDDFILQPILYALGAITVGLYAFYTVIFRYKVSLKSLSITENFTMMKNSFDVFLNNLLPNLYNSLAIVLLGIWAGSSATGIYDAGRKFIGISHSFMGVIARVVFPYLARNIDKHTLFAKSYLILSALVAIFIFFISSKLIDLFFTNSFMDAVYVLQISSISIFLVGLNHVYGTNYLILEGHTKSLRNITIISSLFGFAISVPLVYKYSYIGASITLVLTQAVLGILVMRKALYFKRKLKLRGSVNV